MSGNVAIAASRQAQEVQAAVIMAKNFPRDETAAIERIKTACKRPALAGAAIYKYPRGGTSVTGPSIRLAEVLAQNWGNVDFGIVEMEQSKGESTVMAYAWDLETNTRQTKIFTVKHIRETKKGNYALDDPRDIYEIVANQGARRMRACILGVIPGDVQDAALKACEATLAGKSDKPLIDRVREMVEAFGAFGVTKDMIEARLGHRVERCIEKDIVEFRSIYNTLKDGMASRDDFFTVSDKPRTVDELHKRFDPAPTTGGEASADDTVAPAAHLAADTTPDDDEAAAAIEGALARSQSSDHPDKLPLGEIKAALKHLRAEKSIKEKGQSYLDSALYGDLECEAIKQMVRDRLREIGADPDGLF